MFHSPLCTGKCSTATKTVDLTSRGGGGFFQAVESTSPLYSIAISELSIMGWVLGELVLDLEAFLIRDWFVLQMVAFGPIIIGLVTW